MTGTIKWPGEGGAARKSIYHSFLVKEGRTMLKFKGDPRESKYPGKPPFVYIQVPDDPNEYALNLEPGTEDAVREAPKNVWVYVKALGMGKDDPKALMIEDDAGPMLPGGADPDEWEPVEPPPPLWPEDDKKEAAIRNHVANLDRSAAVARAHPTMNQTMYRCWQDAVGLIRADYPDASADVAVEAAARIANTLFIQASK
jgi:hypothetical protein